LLRRRPGVTVSELADALELTGMAVRRHLDALAAAGLAVGEPDGERPRKGSGRPPARWRLTPSGLELFPRRYDGLALEVLADVAEQGGPEAVDALFSRHAARLASEYGTRIAGADEVRDRVARLAALRDDAGYLAEATQTCAGELQLSEGNCAVHKVAERYPAVCAMELDVLRRVLGPGVEVTRIAHMMAGDGRCAYRISPCCPGTGGAANDASAPAAPA
jgi:predicted ArsR family transcriptional regulator